MNWLDHFNNPTLAKKIYTHPFKLVDVTAQHDDEITKHKRLGVLEYLMKHIRNRDLMTLIAKMSFFLTQGLHSK